MSFVRNGDGEWEEESDEDKVLYGRFIHKLWTKYGYTLKDIEGWTHAGWFIYGITKETMDQWTEEKLANHGSKVALGLRKWKNVMGNDVDMPYELGEPKCVCDVDICWNHIIVDDPKAEEPEMLILGSECIKGFFNIDTDCKCSRCGAKINNSVSGLCKDCKKLRFCVRESCGKQLVKYKRGDFCNDRCEFPHWYCPTKGCGNKRKIYKDEFMPTCFSCYKKKNPHKVKKYFNGSGYYS